MATPRRPLGVISGNRKPGEELSPYLRGRIIGKYEEGRNKAQIARDLKIPESTVRSTLCLDPQRNEGKTKSRSGAPPRYSQRTLRNVLLYTRKNPKCSYQDIRDHFRSEISNDTIRRLHEKHGIHHWRCKKRPYLTPEVAKMRYDWCKAREHWTWRDFCKTIWSDECSAERGAGGAQEWAFTTPAQKWQKEMVQTYKKGKDISVMVWAAIWWWNGKVHKSDLVILERDWESKKHGYTAKSYIDVLEDQLHRIWEPGMVFMQDNAPIHTAYVTKKWFEDNAIPLLDWPPYSPDLNPIEHIWWHLKAMVKKMFPDLEKLGKGEEALAALERALIIAWDEVDETIIESCLKSLCRRRDAVIAAKGWHTKY